MAERDEQLDLTGFWHGLFHYPVAQPPVAFTATLRDADGSVVGSTDEIGQVGDAAGLAISAIVQGRRRGRIVTWLKIYNADLRHYDTVQYEGTVSEDGLEIEGRWTVQTNWSGRFLMIRSGGTRQASSVKIAADV